VSYIVTCSQGHRIVADGLEGKRVRCPRCQEVVAIPRRSPSPGPEPAAAAAAAPAEEMVLPRLRATAAAGASKPKPGASGDPKKNPKKKPRDATDRAESIFGLLTSVPGLRYVVIVGLILAVGWLISIPFRGYQQSGALLEKYKEILFNVSGGDSTHERVSSPVIRGKVAIFSQPSGSKYFNGTSSRGPISLSPLTSDLPMNLQATVDDPFVTLIVVNSSMDFDSKTFVETKNGKPVANGRKVTGGIRREAEVQVFYKGPGFLARGGSRRIGTATADKISSEAEAFTAPGLNSPVMKWVLSLPKSPVLTMKAHAKVLGDHSGSVRSLAFDPNGAWLASGGEDGAIRFWDPRQPGQSARPELNSPGGELDAVLASGLKPWIAARVKPRGAAVAPDLCDVIVWDLTNGQVLRQIPQAGAPVRFDPDGLSLWTGKGRFDVATGERLFEQQSGVIVAFNPNLSSYVVAASENRLTLIDRANGDRAVWSHMFEQPRAALFLPDGQSLAVVSKPTISVVELAQGNTVAEGISYPPNESSDAVAISPDGRRVAIRRSHAPILIYDLASRSEIACLEYAGSKDDFESEMAFSPDGTRLAVGNHRGTVRLWAVPSNSR